MSYKNENEYYFVESFLIFLGLIIIMSIGAIIISIINHKANKITVTQYQVDTIKVNDSITGYNIKFIR